MDSVAGGGADQPGRPHTAVVPAFVVRPAGQRDVTRLAEMYRLEAEHHAAIEGGFELAPGFDWRELAEALVADPARAVLVGEDAGHVVGFLHGRLILPSSRRARRRGLRALLRRVLRRAAASSAPSLAAAVRRRPYGVIEDCWVAPEARTRGIGASLVTAAAGWFAARGATAIDLQVLEHNQAARRFWEGQGFRARNVTMSRSLSPAVPHGALASDGAVRRG